MSGESGSSIPSNHEEVRLDESDFPLESFDTLPREPDLWQKHTNQMRRIQRPYVQMNTEADTANFVRLALGDAIEFADLPLWLSAENAMASLRTDMLVLKAPSGLPVGVIEVKKPDDKELPDRPAIFGELFDYMMFLRSTFNLEKVYGILTRYSDWFVCWLDSSSSSSSSSSVSTPSPPCTPERRYKDSVEPSTPSNPPTPQVNNTDPESPPSRSQVQKKGHSVFDKLEEGKKPVSHDEVERRMSRSRKFAYNDRDFWPMIISVLRLMCSTPVGPFSGYRYVAEVGPQISGFKWRTLDREVRTEEMDFGKLPHPNQKKFYVWENLGCGVSGRAFLATSTESPFSVCVVKCFFSGSVSKDEKQKSREESRDLEYDCWRNIYPEFKCRKVSIFTNRPALLMPYFSSIDIADRQSLLPKVKETLVNRYDNKGWFHGDVKWRNIGQDKEKNVVVFDMGQVRKKKETDEGWVQKAIDELGKRCGAKKALDFSGGK